MVRFRTALALAMLAFALLYGARFADLVWTARGAAVARYPSDSSGDPFETSRKNYASLKKSVEGQPLGDTQKFEKIATLTQSTRAFDADRKRVEELIAASGGLIQLERSQGLTGRRSLNLGIGVPPDKFDGFIEKARRIGTLMQLAVVKNDKTNEYLQLRAKRTTLETTRAALRALQQPDGKIEDKLNILNRLTDIEQQIQDLGVSLGDFDVANEFCTVKLTLSEAATTRVPHQTRVILSLALAALVWTIPLYLMGSIALFTFAFALWLGVPAVRRLYNQVKSVGAP